MRGVRGATGKVGRSMRNMIGVTVAFGVAALVAGCAGRDDEGTFAEHARGAFRADRVGRSEAPEPVKLAEESERFLDALVSRRPAQIV